jgi:RNA polymerase sigma-70 factor, ECF subfamily
MPHSPHQATKQAAEHAARESIGRLVAYFSWRWRDIAAAEDALSDALLKALQVWPTDGIPTAPDAWLLTVARRQLLQVARHEKMRQDPEVLARLEGQHDAAEESPFQDTRLKLMFVCAHPAIDERIRVPLMLQTVLGLQVADMAGALLLSPNALAQRLVRAKQKIREAGIRFEEPELKDMPSRLSCVLECIYGAFGLSLDAIAGAEHRVIDLRDEAVHLCDILNGLLPDEPEVLGLRALMAHCLARREAQFDGLNRFVPLVEQDVTLWDRDAIRRAEQWLWAAAQKKKPGPYQLEAAIQSAHSQRLFTGQTPWKGIAALYEQVNAHFPTLGSQVAGAVALAETGHVQAGLRQLEGMDPSMTQTFQPWWVAKAYLLSIEGPGSSAAADRVVAANHAFQTALGLTSDPRLKQHLESLCSKLGNSQARRS